ncbi:MAG: hypothetical protein ACI83D_000375 [Planctomycetota bacterium]|jgi:hypothetical protein
MMKQEQRGAGLLTVILIIAIAVILFFIFRGGSDEGIVGETLEVTEDVVNANEIPVVTEEEVMEVPVVEEAVPVDVTPVVEDVTTEEIPAQ